MISGTAKRIILMLYSSFISFYVVGDTQSKRPVHEEVAKGSRPRHVYII